MQLVGLDLIPVGTNDPTNRHLAHLLDGHTMTPLTRGFVVEPPASIRSLAGLARLSCLLQAMLGLFRSQKRLCPRPT